MKKLLTLCVLVFLSVSLMGQSSKGFSFQGYARGADGSAMQNNKSLEVKFTIYSTDESNPEFVETQTLETDEFGVFQAVIGTVKTSDFNNLNFAANDYNLKVELEDGGSWQVVTSTSLLAVPYAKAAEKATVAESVKSGSNGVPVGSIMPYAGSSVSVPEGWLLCDGTAISRTDYDALFAVIDEYWGDGDNSTTFNLPDLRGVFLRGVQGTSTSTTWGDPNASSRSSRNSGNSGNNVGSYQGDEVEEHDHNVSLNSDGSHSHSFSDYHYKDTGDDNNYATGSGDDVGIRGTTTHNTASAGSHTHSVNESNVGGDENRPVNAYVNYIIKF